MPSFLGTEASGNSSATRGYWSPVFAPSLEGKHKEAEVMLSWNKEANEQIRYKHAYSHNIPHMSDMLRDQPTATKAWEPAVSPTRKVVDMRLAQRASDDWFETLHARNDKQLSMKPLSNPPSAKPWQTLNSRSNFTSFTKTPYQLPNSFVDKTTL
jgi:hypothetical protein